MKADHKAVNIRVSLKGHPKMMLRRLVAFREARSGVSAIEFALVVPIFLAMYLGTMEIGQGIDANKKVGRAAAMIADLVTQEKDQIPANELAGIASIAEQTLRPYQRSRPTIIVAGIEYDSGNPNGKIVWQQRQNGDDFNACANMVPADVPETMRIIDSFVVTSKVCLPYKPAIFWGKPGWSDVGFQRTGNVAISIEKYAFFTPRMSKKLACTPADCKPTQ